MHHHLPQQSTPLQHQVVLVQTHRISLCNAVKHQPSIQEPIQEPNKEAPMELATTSRWQALVKQFKKMLLPSLLVASTFQVAQTQARDLSISVQGQIQPGVYGQIHVGPQAGTIYQQPVYAKPVYVQPQTVYVQPQTVYVQPILVQAPKKHRKHWKKYCHYYGACLQPVQFVEVDYRPHRYEKVYVYQERDRGRREEKRHYHDRRH